MNIHTIATRYERISKMLSKDAYDSGSHVPKMLSIDATDGRAYVHFIAPVRSFKEVRAEIIRTGGAYRARMV